MRLSDLLLKRRLVRSSVASHVSGYRESEKDNLSKRRILIR
jgi:hypothetical protein